jgi:hypothetical protein
MMRSSSRGRAAEKEAAAKEAPGRRRPRSVATAGDGARLHRAARQQPAEKSPMVKVNDPAKKLKGSSAGRRDRSLAAADQAV